MGLFSTKISRVEAAMAAVDAEAADAVPDKKRKKKTAKNSASRFNLFAADLPGDRPLQDAELEHRRHKRLAMRIRIQAVAIIGLVLFFVFGVELFSTNYNYYARRIGAPAGSERIMVALPQPVLTNEAILSWAQTTVTEVLTYNFANYNERISMFYGRFHPEGWLEFARALYKAGTIDVVTSRQLVSTAAPAAPATIEKAEYNPLTQDYEWIVKVPMIRKFVTNNDRSTIVNLTVMLTIIRVPMRDSPAGIAIKVWRER